MSSPSEALDSASLSAPVTGWRRMLGDWALVGGATAVCHVLGVATSLLFRSLLSPAQMGIWQALKLFVDYGNYANMGVSKGAAREFTIALGHGDTSNARRGLDLAFTVNTLSSLAVAAVLVAAGVWIGSTSTSPWAGTWAVGLVIFAGLAVLDRYVSFHVTILRAKQAFGVTSHLSILEAGLTLGVGGAATWCFGLPGIYLGTLAVLVASLVFVEHYQGMRFRWAWESREIRRLTCIGGPILLTGIVSSLFRSLDKLMILGYLSDREFQLGCYSVALLVSGQLYGLGNMLSIVVGPRFGEKFGHSGDLRAVAQLAARASELQAAAMALPSALAIVVAPPLLAKLLPDYTTGLGPVIWLVPGMVAMSLALSGSQYLIAVERQGRALVTVLAAIGLTALGNHMALRGGFGLVGVAAATTTGYVFYYLLTTVCSFWPALSAGQRCRYVLMHALALLPSLGTAVLIEHLVHRPDWTTVALKSGLIIVVWSLSVAIGWHHGGWRREFQQKPLAA